jgi:vesicle-associated membrane protein 7
MSSTTAFPQVVYVCVRIDDKTTVDFTARTSAHMQKTRVVLQELSKQPRPDRRATYTGDNLNYHISTFNGVIFLCCAERDLKQVVAFRMIEKIKAAYLAQKAGGSAALLSSIKREVEDVNTGKGDKVAQLQRDIDAVKDVMQDNIDRVLERGQKIDSLLESTEYLNESATTFSSNATELRRKMWWKNVKLLLLILFIVAIVIFVIVVVACGGFTFEKCKKSN